MKMLKMYATMMLMISSLSYAYENKYDDLRSHRSDSLDELMNVNSIPADSRSSKAPSRSLSDRASLNLRSSLNKISSKLWSTVPAYSNKVIGAHFIKKSDGLYHIKLQLKEKPICIYAPETYQQSVNEDKKNYLLPKTEWINLDMHDFEQEVKEKTRDLDFDCSFYPNLRDKQSGLHVFFHIDSFQYEIEKIIDESDNIVCFEIRLKK